jgi:hypothetical protein
MKGEDFEKFIKEDLCPRLDATKVVGMDNLNCHKRKEIIDRSKSNVFTKVFS